MCGDDRSSVVVDSSANHLTRVDRGLVQSPQAQNFGSDDFAPTRILVNWEVRELDGEAMSFGCAHASVNGRERPEGVFRIGGKQT